MIIQLCVYLIVGLVAVYYLTVFLHFMGIQFFSRKQISFGLACVPFFYWFARKTKV